MKPSRRQLMQTLAAGSALAVTPALPSMSFVQVIYLRDKEDTGVDLVTLSGFNPPPLGRIYEDGSFYVMGDGGKFHYSGNTGRESYRLFSSVENHQGRHHGKL